MKPALLAGAVIVALAALSPAAAQDARLSPGVGEMNACDVTKIRTQFATDVVEVGDDFSTIPHTGNSFKHSGADCVVVTLSAETRIEEDGELLIQAFVDGNACDPGPISFASGEQETFETHSFTWICSDVSAGRHRLTFRGECEEIDPLGPRPDCELGDRTIIVFFD